MKRMSTFIFLLGICSFFNSSCVVGSIGDRIAESEWTEDPILWEAKTFPVNAIHKVKVMTSGGSISVSGDAAQESVLEMYVKPNNNRNLSDEEIQEILNRDYEISIEQRGGTLDVLAKRKSKISWRDGLNISFKIRTGKQVETDLTTSGGGIRLTSLSGNQHFKTSGGSLKVNDVHGDILGKTSGGSIQVNYSEGNVDLSTSGGSIKFDHLNGKILLSTSGGSIRGQSVKGSLNAQTSGGSIDLEDMACGVQASTSGGSVTAVFQELPDDVQLSTSAGGIDLTLPKDALADLNLRGMRVRTDDLSNFNGSNDRGRLIGSINGGGVNVQASTSAGSVNLNFQ